MKELKVFNEDGLINAKLKIGDRVSFEYEYDLINGPTEHIEGKGIITKVRYDTKYNDRECDEYVVKLDNNCREEEIYGRDITEAFR